MCGVAKHFINTCNSAGNLTNLKIQVIESLNETSNNKIWQREKYWQAQLFTLSHGLNSPYEWYNTNRRGYRK